jgi:hypothetical protein
MTIKVLWHALWLLLLATPIAVAQSAATVFLDELTWTELRDQVRAGKTTIIVPIGGTEQNGPHMVLGKHNVRVKVLSEKIAKTLGNALVAPVVAYVPEGSVDPPTAHMKFPGTITLPDAVFEKMLEYAARSFKLHGFRDIVFLGDHGGYQKADQAVADRLNKEWERDRHTRPRDHRVLPGDGNGVLEGVCVAVASAMPKSARMPGSPTHRWPWLSIHISFVPIACVQVHNSAAPRAFMATLAEPAPNWDNRASSSSSRTPWTPSKRRSAGDWLPCFHFRSVREQGDWPPLCTRIRVRVGAHGRCRYRTVEPGACGNRDHRSRHAAGYGPIQSLQ